MTACCRARYAAVTVTGGAGAGVLSEPDAPLDDGMAIIRAVTEAIADAYRRHGIARAPRGAIPTRFSATLALVTLHGGCGSPRLVGDSGVRLNGERCMQVEKDLDLITSTLRQQAWPVIAAVSDDPAVRERLSRQLAFYGTGQGPGALLPGLTRDDLAAIERAAVAANAEMLPHVPHADIENLVRGGIVNAQGGYQNDPATMLGYSCLDGFDVPDGLVDIRSFRRSEISTVELFSDGYFRRGAGFGVASWEAAFTEVEREDAEKIRLFFSPKGSTRDSLADDRTYLGVDVSD